MKLVSRRLSLIFSGILTVLAFSATAQYNPNTDTYSSTVNFKDNGKQYEYTLVRGAVFLRVAGGEWKNLFGPCVGEITKIAADNNRLLVMTRDEEFFWYCPKFDKAEWVCTLLDLAIKGENNDITKQLVASLKNALGGISFQAYKNWVNNSHQAGTWNRVETLAGVSRKLSLNSQRIIDIAVGNWYGTVSTFYVLTRNTNGTGTGGHIYWIDEEPIMKNWSEILGKTDRVAESLAWGVAWDALFKANYPLPLTGPLAVTALAYPQDALVNANWYYTATGQVQLVPPTQQFNTKNCVFGDSPNPYITDESRINASNSVLCVSTKESNTLILRYIRFDFHHQPDFAYWPVDWAETSWHKMVFGPDNSMSNFNFSTHAPGINPANGQGPWKIPPFNGSIELFVIPFVGSVAVKNITYDLGGLFGTGVTQWDVNNYPVRFFLQTYTEVVGVLSLTPTSVAKKYDELDLPLTILAAGFPIFKAVYKAEKFAVNDGPPIAGIFQAEELNGVSWSPTLTTYTDALAGRKFPICDPMASLVSAGSFHTLALKPDGQAFSWGSNAQGQLSGTAAKSTPGSSFMSGVTAIYGGNYTTFFIKNDLSLWACGSNGFYQMGIGNISANQTTPVQIMAGHQIQSVAAGDMHTLILKTDGTVRACGTNAYGQLGINSTVGQNTPVAVPGLTNVKSIAAGQYHSFALKNDGTLWAWGQGTIGQLANGVAITAQKTPIQVLSGWSIKAIAAGGSSTYILKTDGTLWACGINTYGQLGNGNNTNVLSTPVRVLNGTGVASVFASNCGMSFITTNCALWSCGWNNYGQIGDGTTTNRSTPVPIKSGYKFASVSTRHTHSVFLMTDGTVWGCGQNSYGQIGDGTTTNSSNLVKLASFSIGGMPKQIQSSEPGIDNVPVSLNSINSNNIRDVKIYSVAGRLVKSFKTDAAVETFGIGTESTKGLPRGVYFYKVLDVTGKSVVGKMSILKQD